MAAVSSGFMTTTGSYRNVTFSWSVSSRDIANNASTISWQIVGAQDGGDTGWYYAGPFNLTIDGTQVVTNLYPDGNRIQLRKGTVVKSGTTTITHGSDGKKLFTATLSAAVYDTSTRTVEQEWELEAIPRASSISNIASSYAVGSSHTLNIKPASTSVTFYHKVTFTYGSSSETQIYSGSATSCSWNLTNFGSNIPAVWKTDATLYLYTYSNSAMTTLIGTRSYPTTITVPNYTLETPASTEHDTVDKSRALEKYVQNVTSIQFTIGGSGKYGSTVTYSVTLNGTTYGGGSSNEVNTGTIRWSGSKTARITITDSRGKTAYVDKTISVLEYQTPKISFYRATRRPSDATKVDCVISCSVSSIKDGNTEKNTMNAYALWNYDTNYPSPKSTYRFGTEGLSAANAQKIYTVSDQLTLYVRFLVQDKLSETMLDVKVGTDGILHITRKGLGILKRREDPYALDVNGYVRGTWLQTTDATQKQASDISKVAVLDAAGWIYWATPGDITSQGGGGKYVTLDTLQTITSPKVLQTSSGTSGEHQSAIRFNHAESGTTYVANAFPRFAETNGVYHFSDFVFRQWSYSSSSGATLSGSEYYALPTVVADKSSGGTEYKILTSRDAVTVAQGGTGATNATKARQNLEINQPAAISSNIQISGNTRVVLPVDTQKYWFYHLKFICSGHTSVIFLNWSMLSTTADRYLITDGSSSEAPIELKKTSDGIEVFRDGSTSCSVYLYCWN